MNVASELFFHTTTHECFTDSSLLEYRVRQREHGARQRSELLMARLRRAIQDAKAEAEHPDYIDGLRTALRIIDLGEPESDG